MMLRIDIHHWFAMAAILNPKWPPKYKNQNGGIIGSKAKLCCNGV
jgi:hypothetical protein